MQSRPLKDFSELEHKVLSANVDKEKLCESIKKKKAAINGGDPIQK